VSSGVGVNLMQDPAVVDAYFGGGESAHVYA
jgi:hypothetical protein